MEPAISHAAFLAANYIAFAIILLLEKPRRKKYLQLGAFALAMAFVFENLTTALGMWNYHSEPKAYMVSLYTWLLYAPYIGYCYFAANKVVSRV